ncbi:hypothetical protein [Desulfothermus sp.]
MNKKKETVSIGFLYDVEEIELEVVIDYVIESLKKKFNEIFPQFDWNLKLLSKKNIPLSIPTDPIDLLELGSSIKLEFNFDFVLIYTEKPLKNRFNDIVNAVPSNLFEVAVISVSRFMNYNTRQYYDSVLGLTMHCLGHLWGLHHSQDSVMKKLYLWKEDLRLDWTDEEKEQILDYLKIIADPRLEETKIKKYTMLFYLKLILKDGITIIKDILFNKSWLLMGRLGKLTVVTFTSIIFLFLTAEAWEIGGAMSEIWIDVSSILIVAIATLSLYYGQNLHKVAKSDKIKEQSIRSQLVIKGTILFGITVFWFGLFFISFGIISVLPHDVLLKWANKSGQLPVIHYAKILATFGITAAALGGQLEEEDDIKAVLYYTEET